jgi:hypothetical protein
MSGALVGLASALGPAIIAALIVELMKSRLQSHRRQSRARRTPPVDAEPTFAAQGTAYTLTCKPAGKHQHLEIKYTSARQPELSSVAMVAQCGLSYRSIRGRPNRGNTLLSANQVMAEIRSPSRVSTKSENARATSVSGAER